MNRNLVACAAGIAAGMIPAPTSLAEDEAPAPALDAAEFSLQPEADKPPPLPIEDETPFFKAWKGTFGFGLNGSTGNSENLSLRAAVNLGRKTDAMETKVWANYAYATDDGDKSDSHGELGARQDWYIKESPWLIFADGLVEYDEFQSWNWRLSAHGGVGYAFIKNEKTTLVGRVGGGFNQTLGGADEEFTPEGLLGVDFSHKLTDRQRIYANVDYFPSLSHLTEYRINAKAGWEVTVDPEINMILRVGAEDRYDSNPGPNTKKNDLDYFILLGWTF